MNGLIRHYLPKGADLSGYAQQQLDVIANEINARPRKGLGGTLSACCLQRVAAEQLATVNSHYFLGPFGVKWACVPPTEYLSR